MARQNQSRKTDFDRLNEWLKERGNHGMAALLDTGLSIQLLDRMLSGTYEHTPRKATQRMLCRATGLSLDDLFPLSRKEKKTAS